MKYIRTNDNQIINVGKLKIDYDIKIVGNYLQVFCKFGITPVETYEIVKQADTIEELCDEFIVERPQEHTRLFTFKDLQRHFDYYSQPYHKVKGRYGAIWTTGEHGEPILKSVTKMNEKGELELL